MVERCQSIGRHHRPAAQIFHHRQIELPRQRHQLSSGRFVNESFHVEIRAVHAQDHPGSGVDRLAVIVDRNLVGRTHFSQACATGFQDLWNSKAATDFDQLIAPDDDFVAITIRQFTQDQNQRGGAIVHDCGRLSFAQRRQVFFKKGTA